MKRIVVDPVTRIEGHLRVELKIDETSGKVEDALSSGTAWRGIELIVRDRDPRDAWAFVQRICGVCTTVHALTSLRAVEDALGIEIPKNANYIRNIMAATQTTQDHLIHFYHLHALDWVSPVAALKADPAATASLQNVILEKYRLTFSGPMDFDFDAYPKEFPKATTLYFKEVQNKVKKIVESGQLGIFAAHWWDHPDYDILPPEVHLLAVAHYLNLLDKQRELVASHVIFGGKNPHPHYIVGGMPCSISMNDMNAPVNTQRLAVVDNSINLALAAVNFFYLPDLLAIGHIYAQKGYVDGGGLAKERVLGYGDFPDEPYTGIANGDFHKKCLLRCNGVVENFAAGVAGAKFHNLEGKDYGDPNILAEGVEHSWYTYPDASKDLHPWAGVTNPHYTGPKEGTKTNWKYLDEAGKYSWLKTPKWRGKTAEVGPLARYIIIYTKVKQGIIKPTWAEQFVVDQIDTVSKVLNLPPEKWMPSTLGRTAVRGLEAQLYAYINKYYFDKLIRNIRAGDTTVANMAKWEPSSWPKESKGVGLHEAPRGALGHWVIIKDGKIANYQAIVPTTWNACPRDSKAGYGAYEASMIDTKVKVTDKPLEILKVIHSFDPCIACATHLYDAAGKQLSVVHTDAYCRV
ncbi:nickel-dependent hydrogenase, large subunit [Thermosinus carboxydivorans Nor1]|uniref:Nickel-dependent hydrogenase, large subunit n=1 Tax=Thermosinus carboxydivorans Nor1 TaxID=401526 RepID=A1HTR3_9FIRM|nr:nickel-dependent hydrogenase large subunit [Thermosinus carboxydivorans]EAX46613.1 nickel-dependent hydrogenase, large subunit [Thermosinus carboxydivorans Nor1]